MVKVFKQQLALYCHLAAYGGTSVIVLVIGTIIGLFGCFINLIEFKGIKIKVVFMRSQYLRTEIEIVGKSYQACRCFWENQKTLVGYNSHNCMSEYAGVLYSL